MWSVFVIRQLRGLRANLSGLGPLSWLVNRLQRSLLNMFRIRIQSLLQVRPPPIEQADLERWPCGDVDRSMDTYEMLPFVLLYDLMSVQPQG